VAEQPLHLRPDAALEDALRGLVEAIDWPVAGPAPAGGPDLAAVIRARIEAAGAAGVAAPAPSRWAWRPARRALVVAVIVLLALAALAGAAGLGLPGLRLILGPAPVSPPPSLEPSRSAAPGVPGARMGLGTRVELADLDAAAGFVVTWPSDPALGPPDAAYVDRSKGDQVALVWAARPDLPATIEPGVGLVLTSFRGGITEGFFSKAIGLDTTVRLVFVDGGRAYWLGGAPHFLFYEGPDGVIADDRRWVGDALLWADGPITHRIESALGPARTLELAESMP
jgi:hypothetical protein